VSRDCACVQRGRKSGIRIGRVALLTAEAAEAGLAKPFKDFGRLSAVLTPQAVLRDLCVLRGENVSCPAR